MTKNTEKTASAGWKDKDGLEPSRVPWDLIVYATIVGVPLIGALLYKLW